MATGIRHERLAGGQIHRWYERSTGETVKIQAPVNFYEDFLVQTVALSGMTSLTDGTPTTEELVQTAGHGESMGVYDADMSVADETQSCGVYFGDTLPFSIGNVTGPTTTYLQFECRVNVETLPTTGTEFGHAFFGLMEAMDTDPFTSDIQCGFLLNSNVGAGATLNICYDDATNTSNAVDTGVTLVADDQYRIYRIDFSDPTSVLFYVDGVNVTPSTIAMDDLTQATDCFQPVVSMSKTSSEAHGEMQIDYVRVWGIRSYGSL